MQIYTSFYEGQLKQQIFNSFILLISAMVFNPFKLKMTFQFFQMVRMPFFPKFNTPLTPTSER